VGFCLTQERSGYMTIESFLKQLRDYWLIKDLAACSHLIKAVKCSYFNLLSVKRNENASITGAINLSWCKHVYISILPHKYLDQFLGAFTILRKPTNTFISICLSAYVFFRIQLVSYWTDFHKIWYWNIFRNFVHKIKV
jgi:uncharacterized membrane protein